MSENEEVQKRLLTQPITLPVKWHVPDHIQSRYVHDLIVQPGKREVTAFFFETQLPPFAGPAEEYRAFLLEQGYVQQECVGKLIIAPELVPDIIKALQTGLDTYYAAKKQEGGTDR